LSTNENKHVTATSVKIQAVVKQNNGNIQGELSCIYFEEPFKFLSLMDMIEIMETTFDAKGFPEKHMLPRTFGEPKPRIRKHEMDLQAHVKEKSEKQENIKPEAEETQISDKTCTFDISVRFRHNAEWQGNIHWLEKNVTKQFSGIVEFIKLIDTALAE